MVSADPERPVTTVGLAVSVAAFNMPCTPLLTLASKLLLPDGPTEPPARFGMPPATRIEAFAGPCPGA